MSLGTAISTSVQSTITLQFGKDRNDAGDVALLFFFGRKPLHDVFEKEAMQNMEKCQKMLEIVASLQENN